MCSFVDGVRIDTLRANLLMTSSTSIWKQERQRHYLISHRLSAPPHELYWITGKECDALWCGEQDRWGQPPGPSETFPLLKNADYDSFCEWPGNYSYVILENQRLTAYNQRMRKQIEEFQAENLENDTLNTTNQELLEQIATLKQQMNAYKDHTGSSILKWSCIVGAVAVWITTLVMCCGFKRFHSNREKMWQIQRKRKMDPIVDVHPEVIMEIKDGIDANPNSDPEEGLEQWVVNGTADRRFNEERVNSVAVQDVMMDDVVGEMETEGGAGKDHAPEMEEKECREENVGLEAELKENQIPTKR